MCTLDREEILELLCSKYVYVIRLMKIMGVDENDVEDVATEVFIDAFRGLDNLRDPEKLVPWLKKIARNRASKYFRKRAKRKEISNMIKTEMGEIDIFDTIADEVTVEKLLQDAERRGMVRDMINNLPDVSRRVIRMRFWGEYKHSEIAEIMNININTEKSIYRRSLKHLKEQYLNILRKEERVSGNDNSKRSIGQIISDATDEELKDYHKESAGNMTPDRLKAMAARTEKRKRRHMRELAGVAALFILVVVGGIMVFNTFTTDVDADKNAKEEIVTEDGVVIEDGGWGSSSEDNWVITDWAEVKIAKITVPELVVPEYIPKGYDFHSLTIEDAGNITRNTYIFKNDDMQEYTIQECIQDENLGSTQINNGDRQVNSKKGVIYIEENQKSNNAIICIDDSIIVYIWSTFTDKEIVKIVDNMTY